MERRTVIRLLLLFGIGIPLVVEGLTFAGLVGQHLGVQSTPTATPTPTPEPVDSVGVGDELLAETNVSERLTTATLSDAGEHWLLTLTVTVENDGDRPVDVRLGAVVTSAGTRVDGSATTGRVPADETATATGQWTIPAGEIPETLVVESTMYSSDGGSPRTVSRNVHLQRLPVGG